MSPVNKAIVQRTWGLLHQQHLIDPSNAEKRRQAYGKNFKYDEFVQMPNVLTAVALTLSIWVTALGLAFLPPVSRLILVSRLSIESLMTRTAPMGIQEVTSAAWQRPDRRVRHSVSISILCDTCD
jgi:hypothetical protein